MKRKIFISFLAIASILFIYGRNFIIAKSQEDDKTQVDRPDTRKVSSKRKVQLAILLDTSNSMDGLIEQAKSRLWDIVNTMGTLFYDGAPVNIEIAILEYGNDNLNPESYYIRNVQNFTSDLDDISEKLFALTTRGGEEYCGAVLKNATSELNWSVHKDDIRMIYIAGNEPFTQGPISYKEVISGRAIPKDIQINTIYCGPYADGVNTNWQAGATLGKGKYFAINSDDRVRHIATPYDDQIIECNKKLNDTYIGYGKQKEEKVAKMKNQDAAVESKNKTEYTKRIVSKSNKAVYKNDSWDMVDKYEAAPEKVAEVATEDLPDEMKEMSSTQKSAYIKEKSAERQKIQKEIAEYNKKREEYIKSQKTTDKKDDDFGTAVTESIKTVAQKKGYSTQKN